MCTCMCMYPHDHVRPHYVQYVTSSLAFNRTRGSLDVFLVFRSVPEGVATPIYILVGLVMV
jgi:hypothetical protein